MSGYRFCRTDDIALLVDALNHCWHPHFPGEPPVTAVAFKRSIRDLQVWCSSCMVAFAGGDPIGVLIGAKRASGTLIHRIAVRPDHLRQGHGRHLLTSLSSKLSILGPPRLVAEVPEPYVAARALFAAAGYVEDGILTDFVWEPRDVDPPSRCPGLVIPVTVDDLAANGLLASGAAWERSIETLIARKDEIAGLAVASDEGIEAFILYLEDRILLLGAVQDDAGGLRQLLARVPGKVVSFPRAGEAEIPASVSGEFRAAGRHVVVSAQARSA